MYQVKFFSGPVIEQVQDTVNNWLTAHKDIAVAQSGLNTVVTTDKEKSSYSFYLLFTTSEARIEELKELAAEVKPESSVEVTDINPDVLQPSN